jgi:hypothetical protein
MRTRPRQSPCIGCNQEDCENNLDSPISEFATRTKWDCAPFLDWWIAALTGTLARERTRQGRKEIGAKLRQANDARRALTWRHP